jgi:hypothetical protein
VAADLKSADEILILRHAKPYSFMFDHGKDAMTHSLSPLAPVPDLEGCEFTDRVRFDVERASVTEAEQPGVQKGIGVPGTP